MNILTILASVLIIIGVFFIFGLTPDRISQDLLSFIHKKQSLAYKAAIVQGKKKNSKLRAALIEMYQALSATNSENKFAMLCTFSILGLITGIMFALTIGNLIFIPVFAVLSFALPYSYAKGLATIYNRQVSEELETALSIITTSYISNEDIIYAIESSIEHINPPVRDIFKEFLGKTKLINSNIKLAISQLKDSINNEVFKEWCENLIECQDNITLKRTLQPLAARLSDMRIVNAELEVMLQNPRKEFFMMLFLVIVNIPLLYFINRDWCMVLFNTTIGQVVLGIIAIICIITTILVYKFTQPIEYKR